MTVKELLEIFNTFFENDFAHLRNKVDAQYKMTSRLFISLIVGLLGIVGGLIYLMVK